MKRSVSDLASSVDAISQLVWAYRNQREANGRLMDSACPAVALTSNTIPIELVRAAGLLPVMLGDFAVPGGEGLKWLEPVFDRRIRQIFNFVISGAIRGYRGLIIPRTSEQEYKLYLYLRELDRQQPNLQLAPYLYCILHTRSPNSEAYGADQTRKLWSHLRALGDENAGSTNLLESIRIGNAVRAVIRRLLAYRTGAEPRLSGTDAMELIGASRFVTASEYVRLAALAAEEIVHRPPLKGPRVMIKGAFLETVTLHRALEAHGAVVVAEDDWWGSRAAGGDIAEEDDLLLAVFRKYYLDEPSARVFPPAAADEWFHTALHGGNINAVIFYVPENDDVVGWDYPRLRQYVESRGIPSLLVSDNVYDALPVESERRLAQFLQALEAQHRGTL